MPLTVIVHAPGAGEGRLTFDAGQRIVIGRGAGCDVRLPDPSVSHRHAYLQSHGTDLVLLDEGSTNGTFVGDVRLAPRTARIVRSGDRVRVGRVWLELRVEQGPITRDLAVATRELALALVSRAMAARPDGAARIRVVEGGNQGAVLALSDEGRGYVLGRGAHCDLPLSDPDVSRDHIRVTRRSDGVVVSDLGAKNGTRLGETRLEPGGDTTWKAAQMIRLGRTVLALEEPAEQWLAQIEGAEDEMLATDGTRPSAGVELDPAIEAAPVAEGARVLEVLEAGPQPPPPDAGSLPPEAEASAAPIADVLAATPAPRAVRRRARGRLSVTDLVVIGAALAVLVSSIAGLVWLVR